MDKFNYLKEQLTAALATWQQTNGGKTTVGWMHAANPEVIAALLAELEAKDERIAELEAYNVKLREWNAGLAQESCELQAKLAALKNEFGELWKGNVALLAKLATPVRLSGKTHPRCRQQHADDIRTAGFWCEWDEQ